MSADDNEQKTSSETPELSEEGKEKVRQMTPREPIWERQL
jgi:hypothetical protein